MKRRALNRALALVALTATATATAVTIRHSNAVADAASATRDAVPNLAAPYSGWNVSLAPKPDEPGALSLAYDSPALGRRTVNAVYLPTSYRASGPAAPVLYFLHGTVVPALDDRLYDPATCVESLLCMISGGGGNKQTLLQGFATQRDRANFVVVAPDTHPETNWCETCPWIDGRPDVVPNLHPMTAETVPAETVLYTEIIPLVEHVFNVRRDRGGRGISGFSLGALGALIQGFRHPDRFAYVASISGAYDIVDEPVMSNTLSALGDFRDQGYGTPQTDQLMWRNFNPRDLVGNFAGSGAQLMLSAGDICLPPTDAAGAADCAKYPPLLHPAATTVEIMVRRNTDLSVKQLTDAGVHATQVRFSGVHGANNHRVYADVIVPQANRVFANSVRTPSTFSYRTVDSRFSIWGYDVSLDRERPEFFALEKASITGGSFTLEGSGTATVTTPPSFKPGGAYQVIYQSSLGAPPRSLVTADQSGRLTVPVALGTSKETSQVQIIPA
ncbi:alpha/beta hydrolase [Amycolatopsis thermoflava]|uniref:alpha/beta hydrolase n=1 Tax=Amycolatopsis thermoflava TaxID=84480 RepID=UPI000A006014|nr:alpha/beta hydrolase-fold protein [Amycolatopsis thermoflava]